MNEENIRIASTLLWNRKILDNNFLPHCYDGSKYVRVSSAIDRILCDSEIISNTLLSLQSNNEQLVNSITDVYNQRKLEIAQKLESMKRAKSIFRYFW